ncbi:hypothetical protein DFJ74DRAFT_679954 [Hyaloraphidium curvatum]|nr:hypothetical protein DFJ74DRAFT_679954 [Hyaloraphidium curvatum]
MGRQNMAWDWKTRLSYYNHNGYAITWGPVGGAMAVAYTPYQFHQLQPLTPGVQYTASVQAVQSDGTLTAASASVTFQSDSARVDALRTAMTGFFDDFNTAAGALDETKWNNAISICSYPQYSAAFINGQFHAHQVVSSPVYCEKGLNVMRPRNSFDFTGRTGTVAFDFDGSFHQTNWYLDLMAGDLIDTEGQIHIADVQNPGAPVNMLRIRTNMGNEQTLAVLFFGSDGIMKVVKTVDLDVLGVPLIRNVRRPFVVKISKNLVSITVSGLKVLETAISLPYEKGTLHFTQYSYDTTAADEPFATIHWDNFGFDGPAPSQVTRNYPIVSPRLYYDQYSGTSCGSLPIVPARVPRRPAFRRGNQGRQPEPLPRLQVRQLAQLCPGHPRRPGRRDGGAAHVHHACREHEPGDRERGGRGDHQRGVHRGDPAARGRLPRTFGHLLLRSRPRLHHARRHQPAPHLGRGLQERHRQVRRPLDQPEPVPRGQHPRRGGLPRRHDAGVHGAGAVVRGADKRGRVPPRAADAGREDRTRVLRDRDRALLHVQVRRYGPRALQVLHRRADPLQRGRQLHHGHPQRDRDHRLRQGLPHLEHQPHEQQRLDPRRHRDAAPRHAVRHPLRRLVQHGQPRARGQDVRAAARDHKHQRRAGAAQLRHRAGRQAGVQDGGLPAFQGQDRVMRRGGRLGWLTCSVSNEKL